MILQYQIATPPTPPLGSRRRRRQGREITEFEKSGGLILSIDKSFELRAVFECGLYLQHLTGRWSVAEES